MISKQEQQVVNILNDNIAEMCESYCVPCDLNLYPVARKITAIFKQPYKDTRSRRERALDVKFGRMGVKPRVYHFTKNMYPFRAITIATNTWYKEDISEILDTISARTNFWIHGRGPATQMLQKLRAVSIYGIGICDKSDQFSKRTGRMKAKGRLLQHLLNDGRENK